MVATYLTIALLATVSAVTANWDGNINYKSPSKRHPGLGLDMSKVQKRSTGIFKRQWQGGRGKGGYGGYGNDPSYQGGGYQGGSPGDSAYDPAELNFTHGVASGDPYPNSVILWTRASPQLKNDDSNVTVEGTVPYYNHDTEEYIRAASKRVCVEYKVSTSKDLRGRTAARGQAFTTSDIDFTVKVEAGRLQPWTTYYYQFNICGSNKRSPIGRFKTTPTQQQKIPGTAGLAVFSCSNYPNGYFNAYGNAARKDEVDYFVHLGDYIYEGAQGELGTDPRAANPARLLFTLYDYRTRIAEYRTDLDLLLAHQKFAWITVWDDHGQCATTPLVDSELIYV